MGRGIAEQARDRFPGVDKFFGSKIESGARYGLLVNPEWPKEKLGLFQVKVNYRDKASLLLITYAATCLYDWCILHPEAQVHLNFPGIGYGQLSVDDVLPLLTSLPDTVTIWKSVSSSS
jgi:hypothetical protein